MVKVIIVAAFFLICNQEKRDFVMKSKYQLLMFWVKNLKTLSKNLRKKQTNKKYRIWFFYPKVFLLCLSVWGRLLGFLVIILNA